jgi:hypothetical protein
MRELNTHQMTLVSGGETQVFDDGSTLTTDNNGYVIGFTEGDPSNYGTYSISWTTDTACGVYNGAGSIPNGAMISISFTTNTSYVSANISPFNNGNCGNNPVSPVPIPGIPAVLERGLLFFELLFYSKPVC